MLHQSCIQTVQGPMIALADDQVLYLLEFVGRKGLDAEIERLHLQTKKQIVLGCTAITDLIEKELQSYFLGKLQTFKTPLAFVGSPFQKSVWNALQRIPFGTTVSYKDVAIAVGNPYASRAVACANATNQLALVVPCHRVITSVGTIGGYAAGIERKQWLLAHEGSVYKKRNVLL